MFFLFFFIHSLLTIYSHCFFIIVISDTRDILFSCPPFCLRLFLFFFFSREKRNTKREKENRNDELVTGHKSILLDIKDFQEVVVHLMKHPSLYTSCHLMTNPSLYNSLIVPYKLLVKCLPGI